mmetsp:Transcript_10362/g.27484  ORF Transcript_10362/g.27484 Transcript_10362/m.27484 type:complete len:200 (+) Transcript_10362:379-978(+)
MLPIDPTTEEMLMTRPHRFFIIPLMATLVVRKTELRFVSITASHWVSFIRIMRVSCVIPALFTRMSGTPYSSAMVLNTASTSSLLPTLSFMPFPFKSPTKRAEIASAPESEVAVPTTVAPASANFLAMAAPMPRDAPVTRATLPVKSKGAGAVPESETAERETAGFSPWSAAPLLVRTETALCDVTALGACKSAKLWAP